MAETGPRTVLFSYFTGSEVSEKATSSPIPSKCYSESDVTASDSPYLPRLTFSPQSPPTRMGVGPSGTIATSGAGHPRTSLVSGRFGIDHDTPERATDRQYHHSVVSYLARDVAAMCLIVSGCMQGHQARAPSGPPASEQVPVVSPDSSERRPSRPATRQRTARPSGLATARGAWRAPALSRDDRSFLAHARPIEHVTALPLRSRRTTP